MKGVTPPWRRGNDSVRSIHEVRASRDSSEGGIPQSRAGSMSMETERSNTAGGSFPPLTRADIDRHLAREGRPEKLHVRGLNLRGIVRLFGATLRGANLNKANLSRAKLSQANFFGANLSQVDLTDADLSEADLSGALLGEQSCLCSVLSDRPLLSYTHFGWIGPSCLPRRRQLPDPEGETRSPHRSTEHCLLPLLL